MFCQIWVTVTQAAKRPVPITRLRFKNSVKRDMGIFKIYRAECESESQMATPGEELYLTVSSLTDHLIRRLDVTHPIIHGVLLFAKNAVVLW